jgi:hypothetical protein
MPWSTLASNQTITFNNLQDAVNTGVFTAKTTIPVSVECITKTDANTYVNINTSNAGYASKASNQLVVKTDLTAPASGVVFTATSGLYPVSGTSSTCIGTLTNYSATNSVYIKGLFNSAGVNSGTVGNNVVYYGSPAASVYFQSLTITSFGQSILTNVNSSNANPGWFILNPSTTVNITLDKFDGVGSGTTFRLAQSNASGGPYTPI